MKVFIKFLLPVPSCSMQTWTLEKANMDKNVKMLTSMEQVVNIKLSN